MLVALVVRAVSAEPRAGSPRAGPPRAGPAPMR